MRVLAIDRILVFFGLFSILTACGEGTKFSSRLDGLVDSGNVDKPMIELFGGREIQQEVREEFEDPGFRAVSLKDGDLTSDVVVRSEVNTNALGRYSITYRVEDSTGSVATAIRRVEVRDSIAPSLQLLGGNPLSVERTQNFSDPGTNVSDNFDGQPSVTRTGTVNTDRVGTYRISYLATDSSGNESDISRDVQVIDTQAPILAITQPIADAGFYDSLNIRGICERHIDTSAVRVSGDFVGSPIQVSCNVGAGTPEFQANNLVLTSSVGDKSISVSQRDAGMNESVQTIVVRKIKLPTIIDPAANSVSSGSVVLSGECAATGSGVSQLSFSGDIQATSAMNCSSGDSFQKTVQLTGSPGLKSVTISQQDSGGNIRTDSRSFELDVSAPTLSIDSPVARAGIVGTFILQGSCESAQGASPVTISGNDVQGSPLSAACSSGHFSREVTLVGNSGVKTVSIHQTDAAQNPATDTRQFVKGLALAIVSPIENTPTSGVISVSGTCSRLPGVDQNVRFSGHVQSSSPVACTASGGNPDIGSFTASVTLQGGCANVCSRDVRALQRDVANVDAQNLRQYRLDTFAPSVSITSPMNGSSTNNRQVTVTGTCEGQSGNFPSENVQLTGDIEDGSIGASCSTGNTFSIQVTLTTGDGSKQITARQSDFAGNPSTPVSTNITLDTELPSLAFTTPAENAKFRFSPINVTGTCTSVEGASGNNTVTLEVRQGASVVYGPASVSCGSGNTFSSSVVGLGNSDGLKTLIAKRFDQAGNLREISRSIYRDTTPPVVSFDPLVLNNIHPRDICDTAPGLTASAVDAIDGPVPVQESGSPVLYMDRGDYVRSFTATDSAGNTTGNIDITFRIRGVRNQIDFDRGVNSPTRFLAIGSGTNLSKKHLLCSDIDFNNVNFDSIGGNSSYFIGTLDGGSHPTANRPHMIKNITVNPSNNSAEGIFDRLGAIPNFTGTIQNLVIENVSVDANNAVGGLVGQNDGVIRNVLIRDSLVVGSGDQVGGLVGLNFGQISKVFASNVSVEGEQSVGGLVGESENTIHDAGVDQESNVQGQGEVGGLLGRLAAGSGVMIDRTYSLATVVGQDLPVSRGLIGSNSVLNSVSSSYFDVAMDDGSPVENYGTPLELLNFGIVSSFVNWDFVLVWEILPGAQSPSLRFARP